MLLVVVPVHYVIDSVDNKSGFNVARYPFLVRHEGIRSKLNTLVWSS